jgi:hypothetical protein
VPKGKHRGIEAENSREKIVHIEVSYELARVALALLADEYAKRGERMSVMTSLASRPVEQDGRRVDLVTLRIINDPEASEQLDTILNELVSNS